jgi:sterol desaturase/sphingolipid hydroxylase (fatty acid hydroxylase superfamily)
MLTNTNSTLAFSLLDPARMGNSVAELRSFAILAAFVLFFAWEAVRAYRSNPNRITRQSYLTNLGTFLINDTMMSLMSVSSLLLLAEHFSGFGLLRQVPDPFLKSVLAFLLFDLALYLWHRANHRFDCLWLFHKVHHCDLSMNVTTAFRLHFVEVIFTTVVKAAFVLITGVESAMLLANEALISLMIMFHHANIRFTGERTLGRLIVVPYLHRLHHSTLRSEHDSNYGAVFSFWDRMFRSFMDKEPLAVGLVSVPGFGVWELMKYGLTATWSPAQQPAPSQVNVSSVCLQSMIAEAAFYRAEKRGFAPGYDYSDWLEAEREILSRLRRGSRAGTSITA